MIFQNKNNLPLSSFFSMIIFQCIIYSLVIIFSLALNQLFVDIKEKYISNRHQLLSQIFFTLFIMAIIIVLIFLGAKFNSKQLLSNFSF